MYESEYRKHLVSRALQLMCRSRFEPDDLAGVLGVRGVRPAGGPDHYPRLGITPDVVLSAKYRVLHGCTTSWKGSSTESAHKPRGSLPLFRKRMLWLSPARIARAPWRLRRKPPALAAAVPCILGRRREQLRTH